MNNENKKVKDYLDFSSITEEVLLSNETNTNRLIAKIQLILASLLACMLIFIIINRTEYYAKEAIVLFLFLSLLNLAVSIYVLKRKNHSIHTKHILLGVLVFTVISLKSSIGPFFNMWTLLPLIVVCAYNDSKFSLSISIVTMILFFVTDFISIYYGWFNDLNILVLPENTYIDMNLGLSRNALVSSLDRFATFKNYCQFFLPVSITVFFITTFVCYSFTKRNYENLIKQAHIMEAKARADEELALGKNVQTNMTPINFDSVIRKCKHIDIFGLMLSDRPNAEAYDFYLIDDNHLCLFIGDTSSKGTEATLFMDKAKDLITKFAYDGLSPAEILIRTNDKLCLNNDSNLLITGWLGILDVSTGVMEYSCAGENEQFKSENGVFELLTNSENSVLLGAIADVEYKNNSIVFNDGDRLFLYTDGVINIADGNKQMYGQDRLLKCINTNINEAVKDMLYSVQNEINEFSGEDEETNDITLLAIEYRK